MLLIIRTEKNCIGDKNYKEMNNPFDLPSQSTEVCLLPPFASVSIFETPDSRMDTKDYAHKSKGAEDCAHMSKGTKDGAHTSQRAEDGILVKCRVRFCKRICINI